MGGNGLSTTYLDWGVSPRTIQITGLLVLVGIATSFLAGQYYDIGSRWMSSFVLLRVMATGALVSSGAFSISGRDEFSILALAIGVALLVDVVIVLAVSAA